ncbi:MAG: FkbM family methyltransferase [Candidatus Nomurabacteria bacterium]|nr:MAG: FkbM family methyltransferase [Candidatus Nomurabacteria bacterium]
MNTFNEELNISIKKNFPNNYQDNVLQIRFKKKKFKVWLLEILSDFTYRIGLFNLILKRKKILIDSFHYLYDRLSDDYSRELLIQVLTFRLLGSRKVKLPLNDGNYFKRIEDIEKSVANKDDFLSPNFLDWKLFLFDLEQYGYKGKAYSISPSIFSSFVQPQYQYNGTLIAAKPGDVVIDAGACWGETAMYFAERVKENGKVYSFEFLPENLEVMRKNLSLNPEYAKQITMVEKPVWSKSNEPITCNNLGPGNKVITGVDEASTTYHTISIDDFAEQNTLENVNFIKMDIEGSELEALKGAENVIKKFRPVLSICVYHKPSDCKHIPAYIESLNLGYKFYFDHYSIYGEESVLFAKVEN